MKIKQILLIISIFAFLFMTSSCEQLTSFDYISDSKVYLYDALDSGYSCKKIQTLDNSSLHFWYTFRGGHNDFEEMNKNNEFVQYYKNYLSEKGEEYQGWFELNEEIYQEYSTIICVYVRNSLYNDDEAIYKKSSEITNKEPYLDENYIIYHTITLEEHLDISMYEYVEKKEIDNAYNVGHSFDLMLDKTLFNNSEGSLFVSLVFYDLNIDTQEIIKTRMKTSFEIAYSVNEESVQFLIKD